ncbi:transcription initiation factor TFIID subunit 8 [Patella vulgata]|uniref:transcription initiation factor TFIID subunit 8 n=1 Tax=Patella vulgata TaxID=6465 RepID=UPI0021808647|nr:transcription initiation factor TFIID subunit 8 [Patella vulgata]
MSGDITGPSASRRKALKVAVAALCSENGFTSSDDSALETLTELLQSFLTEVGRSARAYCELSGRTEAMVSDVAMALVNMGFNIESIAGHAKRPNKSVFIPPAQMTQPVIHKTLQAGERKTHPSHIPDHLPQFPDPHTYIRTLTHQQPLNEYQLMREKAASQKRDVERALTRFIAKTGNTQHLFKDDPSAFPLIAIAPSPRPYLNALLPKDQDLDAQEPGETYSTGSKKRSDNNSQGDAKDGAQTQESADPDAIDNPYLRPVKLPKKRKR